MFFVFILTLLRKLVLIVISLNGWLTLRALAADKNCIRDTLLSRLSKSTERPRAKKIPLESSFKALDG